MEMIKNNKVVVAVVAALLAGVVAFLASKSGDEKVEEKADTATEAAAPVDPALAPIVEVVAVDPSVVLVTEVKPADDAVIIITAPAAPVTEKKLYPSLKDFQKKRPLNAAFSISALVVEYLVLNPTEE